MREIGSTCIGFVILPTAALATQREAKVLGNLTRVIGPLKSSRNKGLSGKRRVHEYTSKFLQHRTVQVTVSPAGVETLSLTAPAWFL